MEIKFVEEELKQKCIKLLKLAKENKVGKLSDLNDQNSIAPFNYILQPYLINNDELEKIKQFGYLWQKLTHLASKDYNLIINSLATISQDPLIGPMLNICKKLFDKETSFHEHLGLTSQKRTKEEEHQSKWEIKQKPYIELFRADFFITNEPKFNIKLVEYNNVSVSMAAMSQRFVSTQKSVWEEKKKILGTNSLQTYAKGVANFYTKYKLEGILLAVLRSKQKNIFDQNLLFETIHQYANIEIAKVQMEDFDKDTHVDELGDLYYKKNKKVGIVYYRSGYSTKQNISWGAIEKANLSNAVNIPSVNAFLVNTKKMQAQLSKQQIMCKFLSEDETSYLQSSVIDTWEFNDKITKQEILNIIYREGEEEFVLKPNQEGGNNNLFGKNVLNKIKQMSDKQLSHYILTRKIHPRSQMCTFIKAQKWEEPFIKCCQIDSQVSVFGCVCSVCQCQCLENCCLGSSVRTKSQVSCRDETTKTSGCKCLQNCCGGYLVRSKPSNINEGGIMAGTGAFCVLQLSNKNEII